jgi:hypothetical protein
MPMAKLCGSLAFVELVAGDQLLAQVAARAFGKDGVLASSSMPSWKLSVGSPSLPTPMLPVATPLTGRLVVQHFGGGKAGEDLHAQRLGLLAQPFGDRAQADDVVAVVVEARRAAASGVRGAPVSLRNSRRRR